MPAKPKRVTKRDEAELERLRRLIKENDARLLSNTTAKGEPLSEAQQETLRGIVATQRGSLNEITSRLDGAPDTSLS